MGRVDRVDHHQARIEARRERRRGMDDGRRHVAERDWSEHDGDPRARRAARDPDGDRAPPQELQRRAAEDVPCDDAAFARADDQYVPRVARHVVENSRGGPSERNLRRDGESALPQRRSDLFDAFLRSAQDSLRAGREVASDQCLGVRVDVERCEEVECRAVAARDSRRRLERTLAGRRERWIGGDQPVAAGDVDRDGDVLEAAHGVLRRWPAVRPALRTGVPSRTLEPRRQ